jgi:predicted transcriptional regulator
MNNPRYFAPLFQRQLLGLLLQNSETYSRFPDIWSATYFDETHHRQIAHAYLKIRQLGGEHPSEASLFQELFKETDPRAPVPLDRQALRREAEALYTIPTANIDYSLKEVCLWAQNQALIQSINESVDLLQGGKVNEIRPRIDKALEVGQRAKVEKETLNDILGRELDASSNILGHRFLERGTYATLIGSSGIGKSVAAMQIALEAAVGGPVFGMPVPRPLRVVLVQAEDSKNDRIEMVRMATKIADTPAKLELARRNFSILTTTSYRGEDLFRYLETEFDRKDPAVDLFILNPAFAFMEADADVNKPEDVGKFLRGQLQPFLINLGAAALVVHHTPKLTNRDTSKWSTNTFMYSGHGSAEWTNAPRGAITIEPTNEPKVFEFVAAKRGSRTGWEEGEKGRYSAYYRYSTDPGIMYFLPASPEEVDSATSEIGTKDEDILNLFSDTCKALEEFSIHQLLKKDGLEESQEKIRARIKRLVKAGKLYRIAETTAAGVREVFTPDKPQDVLLADRLSQEILYLVRQYAETGINTLGITSNIKKRRTVVETRLAQLVEKGYLRCEDAGKSKVYFPI